MGNALIIAVLAAVFVLASGCGVPSALTLHPTSATQRIGGPGGAATPRQSNRYVLHAARNESESFQVLVRPVRERDEGPLVVTAQVAPTGLGRSGPVPAVSLYQVLDVHHTGPAEHATWKIPPRNIGWIPDVCWPTRRAVAQDHRPGEVVFLADVHVPPDAAEGDWPFEIRFGKPDELGGAAVLNLTVRVKSPRLPTTLPFKTAVTWDWGIEKYLGRKLTEAERLAYFDFFLAHRFTPAMFWSVGPAMTVDEIKHVRAGGGNVFQVYGRGGKKPFTDKEKADLAPKLKAWREQLAAGGALDYCYALIADEPADEHIPAIKVNAAWLKEQFPELRIWVATAPRKELMAVVDCWDVVTAASTDFYTAHAYRPEDVEAVHQAGKEYWWFYSVEPYAPHANARIDDALVDSRAIGPLSFAAGVDGFEYFWATDWAANAELRDAPWPAKAAKWKLGLSGAGQLCYPNDDGRPIPSLRLINFRDGFEDWALMKMAGAGWVVSPPRQGADGLGWGKAFRTPRATEELHRQALDAASRILPKKSGK